MLLEITAIESLPWLMDILQAIFVMNSVLYFPRGEVAAVWFYIKEKCLYREDIFSHSRFIYLQAVV